MNAPASITTDAPSGTPQHWQGGLSIGTRCATWRGISGDSVPHRHSAAQAVLAREGVVAVEDGQGGVTSAACVLVDAMAWHRLRPGSDVTLVFLEPWADPRVAGAQGELPPHFTPALAQAVRLGGAVPQGFWARWGQAGAWAAPPVAQAMDERQAWLPRACDFIESRLADGRLSLDELAAHLQLSAEHARHRFADSAGVPFKRYVLWRRLRLAALSLAAGRGATATAHEAGFADAAHFARTLKTMFGVTATQIRG